MNIFVWIIFGAIAGWIASIVMGKNRQMGAIANIIVGIIGAFLGGYIMQFFGAQGDRNWDESARSKPRNTWQDDQFSGIYAGNPARKVRDLS